MSTDPKELEEIVHRALDNAMANGYEDMVNWSDDEISRDLILYDADLEDATQEELLPHITSWRKKNGVPNCGRLGKEL